MHGNLKHGMSRSPEYRVWAGMWARCTNPNSVGFKNYGGRGIAVCEQWKDFEVFFRDMGPRPQGTSIERKEVNGNYEPGNCCWADTRTQANNRRNTKLVTLNGETMPASMWSEALGLNKTTFHHREPCKCTNCGHEFFPETSEKQASANRENGKKGGRPRKHSLAPDKAKGTK